jgi:hypothetical protein
MSHSPVHARVLWAIPALLLLVSCGGLTRNMQPFDVSDQNGHVFVGGLPVDHQREVSLSGDWEDGDVAMILISPTASVDLVGCPGTTFELVVDLYTEFEADGGVELADGVLSVWSEKKGAVLVNGIRGRVPEGIRLEVRSATGDVWLSSFTGEQDLHVEVGTGAVAVKDCDVNQMVVSTGTGEVRMSDCTAETVSMDLGVGSLAASNCVLEDFQGDSGTGNFYFHGSRLGRASFVSAVGDVQLTDTVISDLSNSLGTGTVEVTVTGQRR